MLPAQMTEHVSRLRIDLVGPFNLKLQGEIDLESAPELERRLHDLGPAHDVVLDAAEVEFIDSSGLRVVISAHQDHQAAGTRLVITNPSPVVTNLLSITGLADHLNVDLRARP
jgi:anti-sigma B factor antagonist